MTKTTRGKGEGSVYRRGDGYWVAQVEAGRDAITGKRRYSRAVRRHKADALAALRELQDAVTAGAVPNRTIRTDTYLDWWLTEVATAEDVTEGTLEEYAKRLRRVKPHLSVRLRDLNKGHAQVAVNALAAEYAPKTVSDTLQTLRQALGWAVGTWLTYNPAQDVRAPKRPKATVDDSLSADESARVLAAAEGDGLYALVYLALKYGMRLGELLGLRWSDVSDDAIEIRQGKKRASERKLPLTDEATAVLKRHRLRCGGSDDGLVFTREDGRALTHHHVRDYLWGPWLAAAGIPHRCRLCGSDQPCSSALRRFHASRHTAGTLLLNSGTPLEVVSAILGHAVASLRWCK